MVIALIQPNGQQRIGLPPGQILVTADFYPIDPYILFFSGIRPDTGKAACDASQTA